MLALKRESEMVVEDVTMIGCFGGEDKANRERWVSCLWDECRVCKERLDADDAYPKTVRQRKELADTPALSSREKR